MMGRSAVWALLVSMACQSAVAPRPLPPGSREFIPEAIYRRWWQQMEQCAGRTAPFDAVRWFLIPGDVPFRIAGHDRPALGYWDPADNRIVLLEFLPDRRASYIRHEALHAILRRVDHPDAYFVQKCGATIDGPEDPDQES
ncbi:MAG: hypothetical protein IPK85_26920 [Gemmatimonadetes bacterium]|nr:hypothetical protein [Gemmatimonadota bacterium]